MVRKFSVIVVVCFMLTSNLFSGLASSFSFIFQNTDINFEAVNIGSHYNFVKNAPRDFVNLCVNIGKETQLFNISQEKISNITAAKTLTNFTGEIFLITSVFKFKTVKITERILFYSDFAVNHGTNMFYLFMIILIFYLIGYIGLLRVFNDSFCINKNELAPKLCL